VRIRTIKPELLTDEKTAGLSDREWRLFVSCILLSDDYGNLRSDPGLLRGQALWCSDTSSRDIVEALLHLEEIGLVISYSVRNQSYVHIAGWAKHQRIDKPGKPQVPGPDDPEKTEARSWITYFVRLGDDGPVKIGKTIDVAARIQKLQTSAPAKLKLLRIVDKNVETECHRKFSHLRQHGEWFAPSIELLEFIEKELFANESRIIPEPLAPDRDRDRDQEREEERDRPRGSVVPDTAHNLIHCLKVAMEAKRPTRGMYSPGPFADRDAGELLRAIGGESAAHEVAKRIALFVADDAMTPWTVARFCKAYNGIGAPVAQRPGQPKRGAWPSL